jgi:putative PIN family toxin of toxin-antitoxin system
VPVAVTADTNIYISALFFGGRPRQLLDAAERGRVALAISDALLAELDRVLGDKFKLPEERRREAMATVTECATVVRPTRRIEAVPEDPDDNRVLECAVRPGRGISSLATGLSFDSAAPKAYKSCVWPTSWR